MVKGEAAVRFEMIHSIVSEGSPHIPIQELCNMAGVSRSGYYSWLKSLEKKALREVRDKEDFEKILTVPENALTKQYAALLAVDRVMLTFDPSAVSAIAEAACNANENHEDIGARRLHAIFEQILEDISFNAGDENMPPFELVIDEKYVRAHLTGENKPVDIRKYIL